MANLSQSLLGPAQRVLVVGAGMAGLAAAQSLHRAGFQVRVLEQAQGVGGRVQSDSFHGRTIECGAQFPSSGYRHIPRLLDEAGMAGSVEKASPWAAFERHGRLHKVHQKRPGTFVTSGLLSRREGARLVAGSLPLALTERWRDRSSYAAFARLDTEEAAPWCKRNLGAAATDHLLAPTIHGFYFHTLEQTSRALIGAVMSFRNAEALAIRGGWGRLPRALAAELNVQTGAKVEALVEGPHGVQAHLGGDCLEADWAVLAVPAPVAKQLLTKQHALESRLLQTGYAAAAHVALGMHSDWRLPGNLEAVHGLLLAPGASAATGHSVAAMVVESARLPVAQAPEVLTLMLGDAGARKYRDEPDASLVEAVLQWLELRWPGISRAVVDHRVQRWPCAEPLSPVGRARAIAQYRAELVPKRRIVLCGDYLGMPWTDGAVETGLWAAERIRRLAPTAK